MLKRKWPPISRWYASTHHQAPLQTLVQHHNHNNRHTYHSIAIRHVAANKYIHKFWKQTIASDVSWCYVIITLLYITLTLQIMLINVIYLDISVSNIPITTRHGLYCVCPRPIRACITIQHRLWLSEHAQNDPCQRSNCNVVWYNVCMIQSYQTSANPLRPDL